MTTAFVRATASGVVTTQPTCLHGVIFVDTAAGSVLTITDGNGGDTVAVLGTNAARATAVAMFPEPVLLQHGISCDITGAASTASFFYT